VQAILLTTALRIPVALAAWPAAGPLLGVNFGVRIPGVGYVAAVDWAAFGVLTVVGIAATRAGHIAAVAMIYILLSWIYTAELAIAGVVFTLVVTPLGLIMLVLLRGDIATTRAVWRAGARSRHAA
jgi:hypothetical protein